MHNNDKQKVRQAGAILRLENKYVLVKSKSKNHYVFPKGTIEENEKPFLAAKREALEEAGAVITSEGMYVILKDVVWYDCEVIKLLNNYKEMHIRKRIVVENHEISGVNLSEKAQHLLQMLHKTRFKDKDLN